MNKLLLTIASTLSFQTVAFADVNALIRQQNEVMKLVKTSVVVQYECAGTGQEQGRVGFVTFDKDKVFNSISNANDRTDYSSTNQNELMTASLVPASAIGRSYTSTELQAWNYIPKTIKGLRAVSGDKTKDLLLTLDTATTNTVGESAQFIGKEKVEEVKTTATLVYVDHAKGQVQQQRCQAVVQKCEGVQCVNRVVLLNYHRPFSLITLDQAQ